MREAGGPSLHTSTPAASLEKMGASVGGPRGKEGTPAGGVPVSQPLLDPGHQNHFQHCPLYLGRLPLCCLDILFEVAPHYFSFSSFL